jgi:rRNA maturation endonuclease Nob1
VANAFVEYRPKSDQQNQGVTHHAVIVNEAEVQKFNTQLQGEKWACQQGYKVHVARERHRQDRQNRAHWRKSDCIAPGAMRYILDTSAILQAPEILSRATSQKLLIPKAVFDELIARGRDQLRSLVGSLINQALDAGVEIVDSPVKIKDELLASDRNAQRLTGADFDIARIAISIAEQDGKSAVAIITLDKALMTFLASRGISSLRPAEFLSQVAASKADPKIQSSAESVTRSQRRYMFYSAIAGAVISVLGNVLYSHSAFLISTASIWGTLIMLPVLGIGLFWYRQRFRLSYGIFEFIVGLMMSAYIFFPDFNYVQLG